MTVAVDNDVVLQAVCFGLQDRFWRATERVAVLGAARFVLDSVLQRSSQISGPRPALRRALQTFLEASETLEPTPVEASFAAELQYSAQERDLELDVGESQLIAIVITRSLERLDTGDKRAVAATQALFDTDGRLLSLAGSIACLEQLVLRLLPPHYAETRRGVCGEPELDKALCACFACRRGDPGVGSAIEGLESYVNDLRGRAPDVLQAAEATT